MHYYSTADTHNPSRGSNAAASLKHDTVPWRVGGQRRPSRGSNAAASLKHKSPDGSPYPGGALPRQ
ncbi:hypothetical protein DF3PA_250020 [Candidatus Defluviicoccus seviourii]|uniref:Uncharacterized protein n=1 Tax=Candidatus Defluviicoccus seviourii TaxID=2565273 RepID=A0A564WDR1_9PROT|nr:hypothetical protein DF3PA_250020 [Candidatus Defluviicoccus seviourii]